MTQNLQLRAGVVLVVLIVSIILLYPSVGPVPDWWPKRIANPIRLGLDLQGGLHLILEVQTEEAVQVTVDQAMAEASSQMKEARIRYSNVFRTSPTSFAVLLKDAAQQTLFETKVMPSISNFKNVSASPTKKGFEIKLALDQKSQEEIRRNSVRQAVDTIRNRVDDLGVAEPDVVLQGTDRIIVQLPGLQEDTNRAINIIKRTARLEFKIVVPDNYKQEQARKGNIPPGTELLPYVGRDQPLLVYKQIQMTGDVLKDARVHPSRTGFEISLKFNSRGARIFDRVTAEHVHERLAIILDNRIQSAPEIKTRISGGNAVIEGMFTAHEATDLALVLRSGSLPATVKILETRSVGPSLGADSIRLGRNAVILGLLLVIVGMVIYYKWSGAVADIALVMNLLLIFAVMVSPFLRATLTLPGLAGVALTMGMAIDANILIFERIREELRYGKSPKAALELGYAKAFWTIFDSNLTTILAALPLIQFGTGPIKGFAITLTIGLLVSMFTALFVTRVIFDYAFLNLRMKKLSV